MPASPKRRQPVPANNESWSSVRGCRVSCSRSGGRQDGASLQDTRHPKHTRGLSNAASERARPQGAPFAPARGARGRASEQGTTTACFRAGPPARGARNDRVRARRAGAREEGEHASQERSDGRAHAASEAKQEGRAPSERKRARRGARQAV